MIPDPTMTKEKNNQKKQTKIKKKNKQKEEKQQKVKKQQTTITAIPTIIKFLPCRQVVWNY